MREQKIRRRWIPGRQTLIRSDTPGQESAPDEEAAEAVPDQPADATFDRSYGWLDLRRESERPVR